MTDQERRELGEALVRVTEERDQLADENVALNVDLAAALHEVDDLQARLDDAEATASMRKHERDEARDEVVRLGRELEQARANDAVHTGMLKASRQIAAAYERENVRLRTIIGELGAAEAAEPPQDFPKTGIDEEQFRRESLGEWPDGPLYVGCTYDVWGADFGVAEGARCLNGDPDHRLLAHAEPPEGIEALRPGGAE